MERDYINFKLIDWQEKYSRAVSDFEDKRMDMEKYQLQYDGTLQPERGKEVKCVYNFTKELIESAIDPNVPSPKVEPTIKTERNLQLAKVVEAMLINEIKRLDLDPFNDMDERITKVMGGDVALVEWNNFTKTHNTVGDIDLRLIRPTRFTPQEGVYDIKRMDYLFLDFEDTKEHIKDAYGVDVYDESTDTARTNEDSPEDTVTQVWAFFRNDKGSIGVFSWVGDTVIIDDDEYQGRAEEVCEVCGLSRPAGEDTCSCGSKSWTHRHTDFELLEEDIVRNDGTIIPASDYARNDDGSYALQDVDVPVMDIDQTTGMDVPMYEQVFDDKMKPIGEMPMMRTEQQAYMVPTQIPYYVPHTWPVCIRKNISSDNDVFGESDAGMITQLQMEANEIATKLSNKVKASGQMLTKLKTSDFKFSNGLQVIELNTIDEKAAIDALDMRFDSSSDLNYMNQLYYWAKSLLGINDSAQGKADSTAVSGKAKEAQIQRAQARQSSKMVMKNSFYSDIYRAMFEYALAYMDEPRNYPFTDAAGDDEPVVFNRYDFLEQDEYGKWYYNDQFIISIDNTGNIADNRDAVLDLMNQDFNDGLYGDKADPETMLAFWKDRDSLNYPNAKRMVARWQKKVEQKKQMEAMQQRLMELQMQNNMSAPTPTVPQMGAVPNGM